jgi:hypothetical protein
MRRAQETIKAHPAAADLATALAAMRRANVRVKVARRKRGGPGGPGPGA